MNLKASTILVLVAVLTFGCSDKTETPAGQYTHGAIVVNEGGLGKSNGTVTFYNTTTGKPEQNILQLNANKFAGDVAESITFADNLGYVVLNGDNKIAVVDGNTFASVKTISSTDIVAPRYVEVINGKAYVSVWGPYDEFFSLIDSYVLVYDLSTGETVKKIDTDEGTENLLYNGKYLFASNYNYGASHTVAVIDPSTNSLVQQVTVANGPSGMVEDANGKIWVICQGAYGDETGKLFRIDPATLKADSITITAGQPGADLALTKDGKNVVYTIGNSVYQISVTASEEPSAPLFAASDVVSFYSIAVDPSTGNIWIGDAIDYSSPGKVYIYTPAGVFSSSFDAGISPGEVVFK